jgi:hypothetical protein
MESNTPKSEELTSKIVELENLLEEEEEVSSP